LLQRGQQIKGLAREKKRKSPAKKQALVGAGGGQNLGRLDELGEANKEGSRVMHGPKAAKGAGGGTLVGWFTYQNILVKKGCGRKGRSLSGLAAL